MAEYEISGVKKKNYHENQEKVVSSLKIISLIYKFLCLNQCIQFQVSILLINIFPYKVGTRHSIQCLLFNNVENHIKSFRKNVPETENIMDYLIIKLQNISKQ